MAKQEETTNLTSIGSLVPANEVGVKTLETPDVVGKVFTLVNADLDAGDFGEYYRCVLYDAASQEQVNYNLSDKTCVAQLDAYLDKAGLPVMFQMVKWGKYHRLA